MVRDTRPMTDDVLQRLAAIISARRGDRPSKSYTRELLDAGPERCAKKLGEEAIETVIAALGNDDRRSTREAADRALSPAGAAGEPAGAARPTCWPSSSRAWAPRVSPRRPRGQTTPP